MTDIRYYTFIYCLHHDDGYIHLSNKIYSDYKSRCGTNCGSKCELSVMGILSYDGIEINEIKKINTCYNKYGGGFEFKYYFQNIIDENNNYLNIDQCSELKSFYSL